MSTSASTVPTLLAAVGKQSRPGRTTECSSKFAMRFAGSPGPPASQGQTARAGLRGLGRGEEAAEEEAGRGMAGGSGQPLWAKCWERGSVQLLRTKHEKLRIHLAKKSACHSGMGVRAHIDKTARRTQQKNTGKNWLEGLYVKKCIKIGVEPPPR